MWYLQCSVSRASATRYLRPHVRYSRGAEVWFFNIILFDCCVEQSKSSSPKISVCRVFAMRYLRPPVYLIQYYHQPGALVPSGCRASVQLYYPWCCPCTEISRSPNGCILAPLVECGTHRTLRMPTLNKHNGKCRPFAISAIARGVFNDNLHGLDCRKGITAIYLSANFQHSQLTLGYTARRRASGAFLYKVTTEPRRNCSNSVNSSRKYIILLSFRRRYIHIRFRKLKVEEKRHKHYKWWYYCSYVPCMYPRAPLFAVFFIPCWVYYVAPRRIDCCKGNVLTDIFAKGNIFSAVNGGTPCMRVPGMFHLPVALFCRSSNGAPKLFLFLAQFFT